MGDSATSGTGKGPETGPPRIDGFAYERHLRDLMSSPPAMIPADVTLRQAARTMIEQRIGALLIGDPDTPPRGILTERDLLRIAATGDHEFDRTMVTEAMSSPVESMAGEEMLYRALGRMDRLCIRHLCIVDTAGRAIGMISQRDLLQYRARGANMLGDALMAAADPPALAAAFAQLPGVTARLVAEGLGGIDVARVVSSELRALTARAAELGIARLAAEGHGPAPAPWCVLILGSGGRGESLLGADQDNALIHAGSAGDDVWFARCGEVIADLLDSAGVPRCKGGVMAANRQWRGTRDDWRERLDGWLRRARPNDLLNVDIFFDLAPVAGHRDLADRLHTDAVRAAATAPAFLNLLAESVQAMQPRLGLFGRFTVRDGRIDLKRDGLLPLVSLARTLALRIGSRARTTPERLRDAVADSRLPEADAEALIELHAELLDLVLRQQLSDLGNGIRPSNRVESKSLNRTRRRRLKAGLRLLSGVISELGGAVTR